MISSLIPERGGTSLMLVEGGLTVIAIAVAFCLPKLGAASFSRIDKAFGRLARQQGLAVIATGVAALLLRLAILPIVPIPQPFVPDDFSFLLAADTFMSGRLANPTPAMWAHFESIHITMKPTYMSMYFPANGLILAVGKVLFGHPWFGSLCMIALMCAALCWMLQAWLPPTWALLGGVLAILRLGLFSYWINTYSGAASISALGGALILGSLPRFMRMPRLRYSLLMAIGAILLATSRPYEGILLCMPVAVVLVRWILVGKQRPTLCVLAQCVAIPLMLVIGAAIWMGYYDYRAFGSPLTPPYKIDRATYAVAPYYIWQSPRPEPAYKHKVMRDFYSHYELLDLGNLQTLSGFLPQTLFKGIRGVRFFTGIVLLPPFIMSRRVLKDRRIRFLLVSVIILALGMAIEIFLLPHYIAPFTAAFYALGLQAMRHLRVWRPGDQPVGLTLTRLIVTVCFLLGALRVFAEPLRFRLPESSSSDWLSEWYGPGKFGVARAQIEEKLENLPGPQLAIVRYSPRHNPINEWVYNAPDIDRSKVIWAREMDDASNLELIHYYKNRKVWLVQPDLQPTGLSAYPLPETDTTRATDSISAAKNGKKAQRGG
ncbi:hypothetical protein [Alloacidobacterium sp.]|uniref:hypothetical protein n=1 Tax=Alloacidobacterium sp. TaxID=2951999 RepID=UPI002D44CA71|nr:hypothetical protein [Alloacidobacterium sp.]HYK37612.1 hypothetical protein [Alloacidobacterium sp.]